jgi:hypothetical protein
MELHGRWMRLVGFSLVQRRLVAGEGRVEKEDGGMGG